MILKVYETNNGYLCGCCMYVDNDYEWIDKEEVKSLQELYKEAISVDGDGIISLEYHDNGKLLYGYASEIRSKRIYTYMIFGDINKPMKMLVSSPGYTGEKIYSLEEFEDIYTMHFLEG